MLPSSLCGPNIHAASVKPMLAGDGLPEGSTNLVALHVNVNAKNSPPSRIGLTYALAGLKMDLYTNTMSVVRSCSARRPRRGARVRCVRGVYSRSLAFREFWRCYNGLSQASVDWFMCLVAAWRRSLWSLVRVWARGVGGCCGVGYNKQKSKRVWAVAGTLGHGSAKMMLGGQKSSIASI